MATQIRRPSGNGPENNWTASTGNNYDCVSDQSDATYVYRLSGSQANEMYSFPVFDINSSAISGLTITVRHKDDDAAGAYIRHRIIVGGSIYYGDSVYPEADWADLSYEWTTNPKTSSAWTEADIEGTGANPLQYFGFRGNGDGSSNNCYCSEVYLTVTYTAASTNYDLPTASGAVAVAGTAVTLEADRKMASASGAVTTAGTDIGVTSTRLMGVSAGAVTTDGTAVVFPLTRKLATASGGVTTAGTAIGVFRGKGLVTASGGVVVAGTDVAFPITRTLAVGSGGVVVAGTDVTLSALSDYLLEIASGGVTTEGTAVALEAARLLATASGAVTTAGTDINFERWYLVVIGEYPDLVTAARHATYSVAELSDRINFNVEVTGTDYLVTRDVDLLSGVVAGQDKTVALNALVCPFFDASFAVDGDLISAVNYKIDSGSKTAIPTAFGTDLADRVRSFSLSFDSSGEKRLTLYVTDDDSNEYSDELIVRVSA